MSGHDPCFTPVVEVSDDTLASSHPRLSLHALTAQNQSEISSEIGITALLIQKE